MRTTVVFLGYRDMTTLNLQLSFASNLQFESNWQKIFKHRMLVEAVSLYRIKIVVLFTCQNHCNMVHFMCDRVIILKIVYKYRLFIFKLLSKLVIVSKHDSSIVLRQNLSLVTVSTSCYTV